ncbi:MAG TPA: alpha-2-macroglobulin family protein, partial [Polyangiales bacterium]|nr:alpha-2-macroglobulin family protein [Polyangiales bacterium]
FRAYRSDLIAHVEGARDYDLLPSGRELHALLKGAPAAEWSVALADLGDYALHRTFVTPPLKAHGFYTVFASARPDFAANDNRVEAAHLIISQFASRHRVEPDGSVEISLFDGETGAAASGIELLVYRYDWREGHKRTARATTDAAGRAKLKGLQGNMFAIARRGDDVSLAFGNLWLGSARSEEQQTSTFVFTDRSVYRPAQTLHWKVLAYRGRDASWKSLTRQKLTVSLRDANGEEVSKSAVQTNAYGTAFGSFVIPSGRLLGAWSVVSSLRGMAEVRVEEYKRPTFEVTLLPSREAARLNHRVTLRGEAKYYFGLPVSSGRVAWKVERQERYPWWWCWWRPPQRAPQVVAAGTAQLDAKGQFAIEFKPEAGQTQPDLQYNYQVSADLTDEGGETRSASRSFLLGHASVDARLELPVGFVRAETPVEVALSRTNLDGDPRPGKGQYRVLALRQPERPALPADLPVPRAPGDAKPRTPGDDQQPRQAPEYDPLAVIAAWPDGPQVAGAEVATDASGKAQLKLPALPGGAYRIRYESSDELGQKVAVFRDFLVADATTTFALPAVLQVEQASVESGGVARVLAGSGLAEQPMSLEIYADGALKERRALPPGAPVVHEIPITDQQRGGIAVVLVGVRDYQKLEQHASIFVPWTDRALTLDFSTFRDALRPGSKETFRVTVRGSKDHTAVAAAELLAYMYDRSLDVFAPHNPPSPLALYPHRGSTLRAGWSLTASVSQAVFAGDWYKLPDGANLSGDTLIFPDAYAYGGLGMRGYGRGGGGVMLEMRQAAAEGAVARPAPAKLGSLARKVGNDQADQMASAAAPEPASPPAEQTEVRSNFAETAFFLPQLITGADGSAALEFTVPDSVTAWNVWVHAITRDFRSGSARRETRSVKDLIVRPYLPRFVREADEVKLKVVVQNAGSKALSGDLKFELFDPSTQASLVQEFAVQQTSFAFSVPAAGSTNLTVGLKAPRRVGEVGVRVVGKAGDLSDGEQRPLPLLPSRLHLVQSKFATLRGDGSQRSLQLPDLTAHADATAQNEQLVVTVEAQLFMTVLKALPFLIDYPYECSEQTLNRFLSAGIVASVFAKYPAVKAMAADLVQQRAALLQGFDAPDPNRVTRLEESPWLQESRGGAPELDARLLKVLDPEVAVRERDRALSRLQNMQTASGGFPWFPGGPPSPYMTLYLMIGMARGSEFQLELPREMVQRAWQYLAEHYRSEIARHVKQGDASPEFITLLHFATTSFPDASWLGDAFSDAERRALLDYAFERWTKL